MDLESLLRFVRVTRGFDFSGYKRPTLERRIGKRLAMLGLKSYAQYRDHLEGDPQEFATLFNTILINVTSFFRDEAAWETVRKGVIPKVLAAATGDRDIRAWSAGCASGEEAYSLAILLAEALGIEAFRRRVKIYATDVDDEALAQARRALYGVEELEAVPKKLRQKYFEPQGGKFAFRADMRRSVIFGRNDLVQDAPISRLDLLLCRNTLMYFNAEAQERIVARLYFAVRDSGFIFLGKAETLQAYSDCFSPVDVKHRIFAKVPGRTGLMPPQAAPASPEPQRPAPAPAEVEATAPSAAFDAGPAPEFVVDRAGRLALANRQARQLFGLTARDMGTAFKDLAISYRPAELRSLIDQAIASRHAASLAEVSWPTPAGEPRWLHVQASPLLANDGHVQGVVITFTNLTDRKRLEEELAKSRQELETASEELQSANEELETTNEELQSTVEELETTNEELQSGNEEMETMNEELQSTNQELQSLNDELNSRSLEASDANAFLESVLSGVNLGVAVVDGKFVVETWSRRAEDLWGVRPEEAVGKHLLNLDVGLPVDKLKAPVKKMLAGETDFTDITLDATNRRGRGIRCRVTLAPRYGPEKNVRGVILLMEQLDEAPE